MTARARAGTNLTATEVSDGSLPEVRQLAHQMLAEQQAQSRQFKHWSQTAKARTSHPPAKTPAPKPTADSRQPTISSAHQQPHALRQLAVAQPPHP